MGRAGRAPYVRVVPHLEEVSSDVGQGAGGVAPDHLQILLGHLPYGGATARKQGRVMEVPL